MLVGLVSLNIAESHFFLPVDKTSELESWPLLKSKIYFIAIEYV